MVGVLTLVGLASVFSLCVCFWVSWVRSLTRPLTPRKPRFIEDGIRDVRKIRATEEDGNPLTGAIQLNDEWPGLFVRGDCSMKLYAELDDLTKDLSHFDKKNFPKVEEIMGIIYKDVLGNGG